MFTVEQLAGVEQRASGRPSANMARSVNVEPGAGLEASRGPERRESPHTRQSWAPQVEGTKLYEFVNCTAVGAASNKTGENKQERPLNHSILVKKRKSTVVRF